MPKLRVGLLVNNELIPAWSFEMIQVIQEGCYAEISLIIYGMPIRSRNDGSAILCDLYQAFENHFFHYSPNAFEPKPLSALLPNIPVLRMPVKGDAVQEIAAYDLDVIVGLTQWDNSILTATRYGIWTFQHGECILTDETMDGLWEVLTHQNVIESKLKAFREEPQGNCVLARTHSAMDRLTVNRNRNAYYWKCLLLLPRALKALHDQGADIFFQKAEIDNTPSRSKLNNRRFIFHFASHLARAVMKKLSRWGKSEQWLLLYHSGDDLPKSIREFQRIIPPSNHIWADPHLIHADSKYYVFIEEKDNNSSKGYISLLLLDKHGQFEMPAPILQAPYHLSYPFIFEWQDNYYMVPESGQNRRIDVFRCIDFPKSWTYETTIMDDLAAFDTTLHYDGQKWWLFTNIQAYKGASSWDELFLFSADHPLSHSWMPHPQNPIVSDVRSARSAGRLFDWNGQLYRPSQDCSRGYGYRLNFNHILDLNETTYREERVAVLEPEGDLHGIHSFSRAAHMSIIDAKRLRFLVRQRHLGK